MEKKFCLCLCVVGCVLHHQHNTSRHPPPQVAAQKHTNTQNPRQPPNGRVQLRASASQQPSAGGAAATTRGAGWEYTGIYV